MAICLLIVVSLFVAGCGETTNTSGNQTGNQDTPKTETYACPDLSSMKVSYNSAVQSWEADTVNYSLTNGEVTYPSASMGLNGKQVIYCSVGSEEGQNANWVYCGDLMSSIVAQFTDAQGNIIKKKSVEVTFDKNTKQYLSTKCDTYNEFI